MSAIPSPAVSSQPTPTRVILVRHGQSAYNVQKRYQGCCDDSVLTERGYWMAHRTGMALRGTVIDALYTSPLQRAQATTAEILAALHTTKHPLPQVAIHPLLTEIALPSWEGLSIQTVKQQFAQDYQCWRESPHTFQAIATLAPTSFPVQDLYHQARQFWQDVLPRHRGKTILVVSHGGTLRALIGTALPVGLDTGLPPEAYFHHWQQSNGGISVLTLSTHPHQPAQLERMNGTQHLGETLPKLKEGKTGLRLLLAAAAPKHSSQCQTLEASLSQVPIDFWFYHPQSANVTLEAILDRYPLPTHTLNTGVILADATTYRFWLNLAVRLPSTSSTLALVPGTLSVLHYPTALTHPVLQTFNFLTYATLLN